MATPTSPGASPVIPVPAHLDRHAAKAFLFMRDEGDFIRGHIRHLLCGNLDPSAGQPHEVAYWLSRPSLKSRRVFVMMAIARHHLGVRPEAIMAAYKELSPAAQVALDNLVDEAIRDSAGDFYEGNPSFHAPAKPPRP